MMTSLDGLAKLGLFVRPGYLDKIMCATLCEAIGCADLAAAEVYDGENLAVDRTVRRTGQTLLGGRLRQEVQGRLDQLKSELTSHFGIPVTKTEGVSFLLYTVGDFFKPHRDRTADDTARAISVVIFLNEEYSGGELTVYGLVPDAPDAGFAIAGEPGLLVAFDATLVHEVAPVREGRRMTAVDWFF